MERLQDNRNLAVPRVRRLNDHSSKGAVPQSKQRRRPVHRRRAKEYPKAGQCPRNPPVPPKAKARPAASPAPVSIMCCPQCDARLNLLRDVPFQCNDCQWYGRENGGQKHWQCSRQRRGMVFCRNCCRQYVRNVPGGQRMTNSSK